MTVPFDLDPVPVGEYPDVSVAHQAVNSVFEELADLNAENLLLRAQVKELQTANAVLQTERDTAKALGSRRGW